MASEADIANMALGRLRLSKTISDLDEASNAARICNQFYDQCRKEVLRAFPWDFAMVTEILAEISGQTWPGWSYVYQYPTTCLRMLLVGDASGMRYAYSSLQTDPRFSTLQTLTSQQPWRRAMKSDGASQIILTDIPSAYGFFIYDADNPGLYPPDFASVFAWRLAIDVGPQLQADAAMISRAETNYLAWMQTASATSFNESHDDPRQESPSISVRA